MTSHEADRIFILGAGRAGRGLARAFSSAGLEVVALHGRRAEPAGTGTTPVTAGAVPPALARATVVVVAVRDAQLDDALHELLAAHPAPGAAVLHASGASEPRALASVRAAGHPAGTFHPLLPLADPEAAPALFRGAWIGVDGDPAAREASARLASRLGARVLEIPAGARARYHAAAVLASNFPTVLAALAARLLVDAGVDPASGWAATRALLAAASANLEGRDPADALTGPIARGDAGTVERHLDALSPDPEARDVYLALSRAALRLAAERGGAPDAVEAVRRALDDGSRRA